MIKHVSSLTLNEVKYQSNSNNSSISASHTNTYIDHLVLIIADKLLGFLKLREGLPPHLPLFVRPFQAKLRFYVFLGHLNPLLFIFGNSKMISVVLVCTTKMARLIFQFKLTRAYYLNSPCLRYNLRHSLKKLLDSEYFLSLRYKNPKLPKTLAQSSVTSNSLLDRNSSRLGKKQSSAGA